MSKPQSTPRELCPEGSHASVCLGVIDIGTQDVTFKGQSKRQKKLYIQFEPQGVEKEDGTPFVVSLRATNSNSDNSTLAKTLKSWLGVKDISDYDLAQCAGKAALITITHSDSGDFANIATITPLPKGMKVGKPQGEVQSLFLDETFDEDVFNSLNDRIKEKIMSSPEYDAVLAAQKKGTKKPKKK